MPYPMDPQEMGRWCWAAVAFSVEKYFDPSTARTQCSIATLVRGIACCGTPLNPACNVASSLERALTEIRHLDPPRLRRVSFARITGELNAYRPVPVRVAWPSGSAHFLVISGYRVSGGIEIVELSDPLYGPSTYRFAQFANAYRGFGSWTDTYIVR